MSFCYSERFAVSPRTTIPQVRPGGIYFRQMSCAWQPLRFAASIILGVFSSVVAATGQSSPAELSTDCSAYASIPLPAEAAKIPIPEKPPDCASDRSYRGLGRPVNYAEARACAWQELLAKEPDPRQNPKGPTAWGVGGPLILADIYFNGAGVKRNIPLAMHFACEFEEATAMLALPEIMKLGGSRPVHGPFEFCDYAATTVTENFCGGYASAIEDDRRNRYFNSLESSMKSEQKAAFERLLAAQDAYVEAHAGEVSQAGTIRVMRTIGSQGILRNLFRAELVHFESGKWPTLTASQIASAYALVQREYEGKLEKLRAQTKEEIDEGEVTAENLSKVESTWEAYRDAWAAFARARYPEKANAIRAAITLDRYRLLKTIG